MAFAAVQRWPVLGRLLDVLTSTAVSFLRGGSGCWTATGLERCRRPEKLLTLYEYEGCPYCRKVRRSGLAPKSP